ncbi:MAG TPA: cytochrome P450 [Polyangiaceae bacterium]|jgi:cytochrome P450
MGTSPVLCVADAGLAGEILRNEQGIWSAANPGDAMVDELAILDDAQHREVRALFQRVFDADSIDGYLRLADPLVDAAIERWLTRGRVHFKREVVRLMKRVTARALLGARGVADAEWLARALAWVCAGRGAVLPPWLSPKAIRARLAYAGLRGALSKRTAAGSADLLGRLRAAARDAGFHDDERLLRLFLSVVVGAVETTASAMASMGYLLAKHEPWQERLRDEARDAGLAPVTCAGGRRLELARCTWNESMRLFPVAPHVPRRARRTTRVGGADVPAGTGVLVMLTTLWSDPAWWSEPDGFDPDRFSAARAEDRRRKGLFLPFGAGAHACIGMQLATAQALSFWHAMLTRCRFSLAPGYDAHHTFSPMGMVSGDVRLAVKPA